MRVNVSYDPPIPAGEYAFSILKAEIRKSKKNAEDENIFVSLAVAEGEHEGRHVPQSVSPKMKTLFRSFMVATGMMPEDTQGEIDITQEQLDGLNGLVVIGKGAVEEFKGMESFKVSKFSMHESVAKSMESALAESAAPAQPAPAATSAPAKSVTQATKPVARRQV